MIRFYWFIATVILALTIASLIAVFKESIGYLLWFVIGAFLFTSLVKTLINNQQNLILY